MFVRLIAKLKWTTIFLIFLIRDMVVRGDRGAEAPEMVKSVSEGPERLEQIAINKL